MDHRDLALGDLARDYAALEADLVTALADAATYRRLYLTVLDMAVERERDVRSTRATLQRVMRITTWTPDEGR